MKKMKKCRKKTSWLRVTGSVTAAFSAAARSPAPASTTKIYIYILCVIYIYVTYVNIFVLYFN